MKDKKDYSEYNKRLAKKVAAKKAEAQRQKKLQEEVLKKAKEEKDETLKQLKELQKQQSLIFTKDSIEQAKTKESQLNFAKELQEEARQSAENNPRKASNKVQKKDFVPAKQLSSNDFNFNLNSGSFQSFTDWRNRTQDTTTPVGVVNSSTEDVLKHIDNTQTFVDPSPVKPELQRGNRLGYYNNVMSEIDNIIKKEFKEELEKFNNEYNSLKEKDESDGIDAMEVDDFGNLKPNPRNRALNYKEQFDATIGAQIQKRKQQLFANFDPYKINAGSYLADALGENTKYDGYKKSAESAKKAILDLENFSTKFDDVANTLNRSSLMGDFKKLSYNQTLYEKFQNEMEEKAQAVATYLESFDFPEYASKLPAVIKQYMKDLGNYYNWYGEDGKLINRDDIVKTKHLPNKDQISGILDEITKEDNQSGLTYKPNAEQQLDQLDAQFKSQRQAYELAQEYSEEIGDKNQYQYTKDALKNFERIEDLIALSKKHIRRNKEVKEAGDGWFGGGFWTTQNWYNIAAGSYDVLSDKNTWLLDIPAMIEANDALKFANKVESGAKLSESEKMLAQALALETFIHGEYGDYENVAGYKAGNIATESMKFMAETMLTEGLTGTVSKALRASKLTMKEAVEANMKRLADIYVEQYDKGTLRTFWGRQMRKAPEFGKLVGLQTGQSLLMVNSIQLPNTISEAREYQTGDVAYRISDSGTIVFDGFTNRMSAAEAWATAEGSMTIENLSEFSGEWGMGKIISKPFKEFVAKPVRKLASSVITHNPAIGRGVTAIGNYTKRLSDEIQTMTHLDFKKGWNNYITRPSNVVNDVLKKAHVSGILGEIGEEYTAMPMQRVYDYVAHNAFGLNTLVTESQYSLWDDINPFTEHGRQTFFDIAYGIALSQAMFGVGGAFVYANAKHNYKQAEQYARSVFGDEFDQYKDAIINADTRNLSAVMTSLYEQQKGASHKKALVDYYMALADYRGLSARMMAEAEDNNKNLQEKALEASRTNGYTAQSNGLHRDLLKVIDIVHNNTLTSLDLTDEQLAQEIQDHGSVEDYAKYLYDNDQMDAAEQLLAEERLRARQEGALKAISDNIQRRLDSNDKFINRITATDGSIYMATDRSGNTVYVTHGAHEVNSKKGTKIQFDKNTVVVDSKGNVKKIDGSELKDGERRDVDQLRRFTTRQIYTEQLNQFEKPIQDRRIGAPIAMGYNKFGTILYRIEDGRVMYSVNDGETEDIRFGEAGQSIDAIIEQWDTEYNNEIAERELLGAVRDLAKFDEHKNAKITAADDVVQYMNDMIKAQEDDVNAGKHGRGIKYAEDKKLSAKDANSLFGKGKLLTQIKENGGADVKTVATALMKYFDILPDVSNLPRLDRILRAWYADNITDDELKYILTNGEHKINKKIAAKLDNIIIDQYGNVRWGKVNNGTVTYIDPVSDPEIMMNERLVQQFEHPEKSIKFTNFFTPTEIHEDNEGETQDDTEPATVEPALTEGEKRNILADKIASIIKSIEEHGRKLLNSTGKQSASIKTLLNHATRMHGRILHVNDCNMFIIDDEGNIRMYNNNPVNFGILFTERFQNQEILAKRRTLKVELEKIYNELGIGAFRAKLNELGLTSAANFEMYAMYLQLNPDALNDVCASVAMMSTLRKGSGGSLQAEATMHGLLEWLFNGHDVQSYEDATFEAEGVVVNVKDYMSKEAYNHAIDNYKRLVELYLNTLGWQIIHNDDLVFTSDRYDTATNQIQHIATKPNLVGVDTDGNYHIINIATAWDYFDSRAKDHMPILDSKGQIRGRDTKNPVIVARTLGDQYALKLTLDAEIIEESTGITCESIEMQPWRLDYQRKDDTEHQSGYITDAENTTYHERIVNRNGGQYIVRDENPVANRIVLRRNSSVQDRFVTEDQREQQYLYQIISEYVNRVKAAMTNVEMRELDEDERLSFELELQQIDDQINEYIQMHESGLFIHIDEQHAIYSTIDDLMNSRAALTDRISDRNTKMMEDRIAREAALGLRSSLPENDAEYWEAVASEEQQLFALTQIQFTSKYNDLYNYMMQLFEYKYKNKLGYVLIPVASYETVRQYFADVITISEIYPEIAGELAKQLFDMHAWFNSNVIAEGQSAPTTSAMPGANLPQSSNKPKRQNIATLADSHTNATNKITGQPYVNTSTSVDQNGLSLSSVLDDPDFITNAEFEYVLDEDEKNANVTNPKLHIRITYNGSVFAPVAITTSKQGYKTFYLPIVARLKAGERIFPNAKPSRISGNQITNQAENNLAQVGLVNSGQGGIGVSVYDLGFDEDEMHVGITDTRTVNGETHTYLVVPAKNTTVDEDLQRNAGIVDDRRYQQRSEYKLSDGVVVDEINNGNGSITKGTFFFIKKLLYREKSGSANQQIMMRKKRISVDDASFILDALLGKFNYRNGGINEIHSSLCMVNGNAIQASILDFVDMLIPCYGRYNYNQEQKFGTNVPYLDLTELANGIVRLRGLDVNGQQDHPFDIINDPNGFISFLSQNVNVYTSIRGFANDRFGSNNGSFRPVNALQSLLSTPGSNIRFGNSSLVFEHEDFNHTAENGVKKPISGLGWYVKTGQLVTEYSGSESPQLLIDETAGFNSESTKLGTTDNVDAKEAFIRLMMAAGKTRAEAEQQYSNLRNFFTKSQLTHKGKTINREKAKAEILKIAGDCGIRFSEGYLPEEDEDLFVALLQQDAHVVGKCYSDLILLSDLAADGVLYHEAFHRVLELLMPERERQKVYNRYRAVHDLDNSVSDNEVGEMIADQFMDYMLGRMTKNKGFINNLKNIISWIKLMKNIGSYSLYKTYVNAKNGKYANVVVTDEMRKRFDSRTKYGHYNHTQIHGMDLQHTLNMPHYNSVIDFMVYATIHCTQQNIKWDGSNITDFKLTRELFETDAFKASLALCPEAQQLAINEILNADNWQKSSRDIASRLSLFTSTPKHRLDDEHSSLTDGQSDDNVSGWYDDYDPYSDEHHEIESTFDKESFRDSFEFSKFSTATEEVKFFFSGIIKQTFDANGNLVNVNNSIGLPTIMSTFEVFDMAITRLHRCYNIPELIDQMNELGKQNPVFAQLSQRINQLWEEHKNYKSKNGRFNADSERFFSRLINSVRCANLESRMTKASKTRNGQAITDVDVDQLYKQDDYINQWCEAFAFGQNVLFYQDENEKYVPASNIEAAINYITYHFNQLRGLANGTTQIYFDFTGGNVLQYDPNTEHGVYNIKNVMCENLSRCGIYISIEMLDEYLRKTYNNTGIVGFTKFIRTYGQQFEELSKKISALYSDNTFNIQDGKIGGFEVEEYLKNIPLLQTLSKVRYAYERTHNQMSTRIADGATQYAKGENNLLSSTCTDLERNTDRIKQLLSLAYNAASILLGKSNDRTHKFTYTSYKGFITDDRSDLGSDYTSMSEREDWTSKATLLMNGYFLFPTMSDKKTYGYIDVHDSSVMPGLNENKITQAAVLKWIQSGESYLMDDDALDQLIEYARSEHNAIGDLLDQICIKTADGTLTSEIDLSSIQYKVNNFHEGLKFYTKQGKLLSSEDISILKKQIKDDIESKNDGISKEDLEKEVNKQFKNQTLEHRVILGARYSSLLGVNENGTFISFNSLCDEDGNYMSPLDNYLLAKQYFFDSRDGETPIETKARQRMLIREQLAKQVDKQFVELKRMGLVEEVNGLYKNVGLDSFTINNYASAVRSAFEQIYPGQLLSDERAQHAAIKMYVADINNRHVISMNESERLLSGRIAFFKWSYNTETGRVTDMRKDWSKRLGGLVSTGIDNNMWIDGIEDDNAEYTCAIVENEKFPANNLKEIQDQTYETEIKTNLILAQRQAATLAAEESDTPIDEQEYEDLCDAVDEMTLEEAKELLKTIVPESQYNLILKVAENKAKAFAKTDVADGAAYMSDAMCERLLRMVGCYDSKVLKAFEILRSDKITSKLILNEAYQQVITTVIGAQKYTAYGFRFENGEAVPYYNKMALFPIFKCMCTGNLSKIYAQMDRQGIDILHVESAVKVGISDSTPIDWDKVGTVDNFFSVRKQRYADLRKQFNTDPKGEEMRTVGTQMTKVVMSALDLYKNYGNRRGIELRNDIMKCINALSTAGYNEVVDEFFDTNNGERVLNVEKFSELLTRELEERNAPYELLDAVSVIEREVDGKKVKDFKIPLSALSSMAWLQSILTSHINKKVVDINMPGSAFYQRSVWGMEGPNASNIFTDENMPAELNGGKKLEVRNGGNSMDCVLSIDFFEHILEKAKVKTGRKIDKKDKDGNYITRKQYIKNDGSSVDPYEVFKEIYELHPEIHQSLVEARENSGEEGRTLESFWGTTTNTDPDLTGKTKNDFYNEALASMGLSEDSIIEERVQVDEIVSVSSLSFEQQKQWLIDNNIIGENAENNIIGYRIPTQALSSIHGMRCVDVIPVVRDTVILPAEFTTITGSDFDIDKLFLTTKHYRVEGHGLGKATSEFKEGSTEYYANRLVDNYMELLTDMRSFNQLNGSIDKDTEVLKELDKELSISTENEPLDSYSVFSIRQLVSTKNEFVDGKTGIGPFALNNNSHILALLYKLKFTSHNSFLAKLGLLHLDHQLDRDGRSISSWLSGLINAHVDVAKDPYISRLNVNPYTYNLTNLLVRTGLGKHAFYFLNQPILKKLSEVYASASGTFLSTPGVSKSERQKQAEHEFIMDYAKSIGWSGREQTKEEFAAHYATYIRNKYKHSLDDVCVELFDSSNSIFKTHSTHATSSHVFDKQNDRVDIVVKGDKINMSFAEMQLIVYCAKVKFDKPAKKLADLVKYTKIDTKKQGKTLIEQAVYLKNYIKLFAQSRVKPTFSEDLNSLNYDSYVNHKTSLATSLLRDILGKNFIEGTRMFQDVVYDVLERIGQEETSDAKLIDTVSKSVMAAIKSKWFFGEDGYCNQHNIDPKDLFVGKDSIYRRLLRIKGQLMKDRSSDYVDANGNITNYLLNSLISSYKDRSTENHKYAGYNFVRLATNMNGESIDGASIVQAWDELLNDSKNPELLKFARDLVVYAYAVSADTGGLFDLCKYVPNSFKQQESAGSVMGTYELYMRSVTNFYNGTVEEGDKTVYPLNEKDIEDVLLNNVDHISGAFVPNYDEIVNNEMTVVQREVTGLPRFIIGLQKNKEYMNGVEVNRLINSQNTPPFFKLSAENEFGWRVYGIVEYGQIGGTTFPIYGPIEYAGRKFKGGYRIQEYSRNKDRRRYFDTILMNNEASKYTDDDLRSVINKAYELGKYYITDMMLFVMTAIQNKSIWDQIKDYIYEQPEMEYVDSQGEQKIIDPPMEIIDITNTPDGELMLHTKDSRYEKLRLAQVDDDVLKAKAESLTQIGYHIEFYNKHSVQKRRGQEPIYRNNLVMTISLLNQANKGYFELVKDDEAGYYSIHFKTKSAKANNETKYASVPLTNEEKAVLFDALIYAIPDGCKVSTWGTLSKGGVHAMETLGDKSRGQLIKTDETRKVKAKREGRIIEITEDGSQIKMDRSIEIPVWLKISDTNTSTNQLKDYGPSVEQLSTGLLHQIDVSTELVQEFGQDYLSILKDSIKLAKKGLAFYEGLNAIPATFTEQELDAIANGLESALTPAEELEFQNIRKQYTIKKRIKGTVIDTFAFPGTPLGRAAKKRYSELLNKGRFSVASVSRFVDPAEHADAIIKFLEDNFKKPIGDPTRVYAIEVWSKHDGLPMRRIIEAAKKYKVACMNSFSITGLGDTEYEKGVMRWLDMTDNLISLVEQGVLDPHSTTIRIDPMLPGKTDPEVIKLIVRKMKAHGFNKFVTSLVQSYGYTQGLPGKKDRKVIEGINQASQRESGTDYNWDYFYGRNSKGTINFLPNSNTPEYKALVQALLDLQAEDKNILIETCAFHIDGVDESACLDPLIMERVIGRDFTSQDGSYNRDTSRPDCMCYGAHGGRFAWDNNETCFSSCSYCYAGQSQSDNPLVYYDENGNLMDNDFTRTSELTQNIYAGTNENADLSNFAERPFTIPLDFMLDVPSRIDISHGTIGMDDKGNDIVYRSVESAFQAIKSIYSETGYPAGTDFEALRKQGKALRKEDFSKMSGPEARRNGRNITDLDRKSWDMDSSAIMKALIKMSFEQNPQALKRLLATGNATLTHTQEKGKWGTEFPKLLMEVRAEFLKQHQSQQTEQQKQVELPKKTVFGNRKEIGESVKQYVTERILSAKINVLDPYSDKEHKEFTFTEEESKFLITTLNVILNEDMEDVVNVPYREWKQYKTNNQLVAEEIEDFERDWNGRGDSYHKDDPLYDKNTKSMRIDKNLYLLMRLASKSENLNDLVYEFVRALELDHPAAKGMSVGEYVVDQLSNGVFQYDDSRQMTIDFNKYNSVVPSHIRKLIKNGLNDRLADVVIDALQQIDIKFEVDNSLTSCGVFKAREKTIYYNPNNAVDNTLIHEAIHAVTTYLLDADQSKLPQEVQVAVKEIEFCYEALREWVLKEKCGGRESELKWATQLDALYYGLSNLHEFVAELSRPEFIQLIREFDHVHKDKPIFSRLVEAILRLFGISKQYSSLETTSKNALMTLFNNQNLSQYEINVKRNKTLADNVKNVMKDENTIMIGRLKSMEEALENLEEPESGMSKPFDVTDTLNSWQFVLNAPKNARNFFSKPGGLFVYDGGVILLIVNAKRNNDNSITATFIAYNSEFAQNNLIKTKVVDGHNVVDRIVPINDLQIGRKRKQEMRNALSKLHRFNGKQDLVERTISYIEMLGEQSKIGGDPKLEKMATKWVLNGTVAFPEDDFVFKQASNIVNKLNLDYSKYSGPAEVIDKHQHEVKSDPIDPDTVPEFTNKQILYDGVTVYDVLDDFAGQVAVRKTVDTHWGFEAQPWCLIARYRLDQQELGWLENEVQLTEQRLRDLRFFERAIPAIERGEEIDFALYGFRIPEVWRMDKRRVLMIGSQSSSYTIAYLTEEEASHNGASSIAGYHIVDNHAGDPFFYEAEEDNTVRPSDLYTVVRMVENEMQDDIALYRSRLNELVSPPNTYDYNESLTEAGSKWNLYSRHKKQIAFKHGKLLAFNASTETKDEWWDRMDVSTPYINAGNNSHVYTSSNLGLFENIDDYGSDMSENELNELYGLFADDFNDDAMKECKG